MIRKAMLASLAALAMLAGTAGAAMAFTGDWYYDNNPGGWDVLQLGDGNGSYLHLVGTEVSCGAKGAPYARIHQILSDANDASGVINWWITNSCDGQYDHICVSNDFGATACSTYEIDGGWYDWRLHVN